MARTLKPALLIVLISISLSACKMQQSDNTTPAPQSANSSQSTTDTLATENFTASFAIFTNGTFRVFTAAMYHNQSQDVYIDSSNPNIIQVKKNGITWKDFFDTLPFELTDICLTTGTGQTFCTNDTGSLKFYINGQYTADALNQEIKSGDILLVSYGAESPNDPKIQAQLDQIPTLIN